MFFLEGKSGSSLSSFDFFGVGAMRELWGLYPSSLESGLGVWDGRVISSRGFWACIWGSGELLSSVLGACGGPATAKQQQAPWQAAQRQQL